MKHSLSNYFPLIPQSYEIDENGVIYKDYNPLQQRKQYQIKGKSYALKTLYRAVFNKEYCIDKIQSLQDEEWKAISFSCSRHFISSYGRIKSLCGYEAKLLKPTANKKGYERVKICGKDFLIHRLVAEAFIPNTDKEANTVDHIDFNPHNNTVRNLQWLSRADNARKKRKKEK